MTSLFITVATAHYYLAIPLILHSHGYLPSDFTTTLSGLSWVVYFTGYTHSFRLWALPFLEFLESKSQNSCSLIYLPAQLINTLIHNHILDGYTYLCLHQRVWLCCQQAWFSWEELGYIPTLLHHHSETEVGFQALWRHQHKTDPLIAHHRDWCGRVGWV